MSALHPLRLKICAAYPTSTLAANPSFGEIVANSGRIMLFWRPVSHAAVNGHYADMKDARSPTGRAADNGNRTSPDRRRAGLRRD